MKRSLSPRLIATGIVVLYIVSYAWFRSGHQEPQTGTDTVYVVFPERSLWVYYLYRPLSYIDGAVTGMRFHIGPHREPGGAH